jgi:hypothetical protein
VIMVSLPSNFPWFSPIRKGQKTITRSSTVNALHVVVCGDMDADNITASPSEDKLVGSRSFLVVDSDGLSKTLFDVRDWLKEERENMGRYYLLVRLTNDLDGDGTAADDIGLYMVSDNGELSRTNVVDYGSTTGGLNAKDSPIYIPAMYEPSRDACWRTFAMVHNDWSAAETHTTHISADVWKRPLVPANEVIT